MKKYIILIIAIFGFLVMPNVSAKEVELPEVTDHEKVTVYLFRGEGCSHCYDFLTYFADVYAKYTDYFEIVAYESWKNSDNQELMYSVKELVGEEANVGVPFIVVGDDYHLLGFGDDSGEEIVNEALEAYQDEKYTDIVAKAIKDNKVSPTAETIVEAATSEGIKVNVAAASSEDEKGISDGVVVAIVFGVIILGFGGLVLISRK